MTQLLTTKEASTFLRVPTGTLKYWRSTGLGPVHIKIEGSVRYSMSDLELYVEANRRVPSVRATVEAKRGRL